MNTEIKYTTEITGFLDVITKRLENRVVKANKSVKKEFILIHMQFDIIYEKNRIIKEYNTINYIIKIKDLI